MKFWDYMLYWYHIVNDLGKPVTELYDSDLFEQYTASEHGLQNNKVPIRIFRRQHSVKSPVKLHSHNFWEIVIVLSGTCNHVINLPESEEIVYPISSGNVCIISPGEKHSFSFKPDEEIQIINILFNPLVIQREESSNWDNISAYDFINVYPYIPAYKRHQYQISLDKDKMQFVCSIIEQMEKELKSKALGYNTMTQLYFSIILTVLMRDYYSIVDDTYKIMLGQNCVQEIVHYINKNYNRQISLEELSQITHFSIRHLTRKFKTVMGVSVTQYILQQRMANAKVLLQSTNIKIEDIAMENGFGNVSYFCRQFKEENGITPQQFRKLQFNEI